MNGDDTDHTDLIERLRELGFMGDPDTDTESEE